MEEKTGSTTCFASIALPVTRGIDDVFYKKREAGLLNLLCAASFAGMLFKRTHRSHTRNGGILEQPG